MIHKVHKTNNTCIIHIPIYISKGFEDCSILNQFLNEYDHDLKTTVKMFSSRRIPDAEAISDLAFYNYIEVSKYLFNNFKILYLTQSVLIQFF